MSSSAEYDEITPEDYMSGTPYQYMPARMGYLDPVSLHNRSKSVLVVIDLDRRMVELVYSWAFIRKGCNTTYILHHLLLKMAGPSKVQLNPRTDATQDCPGMGRMGDSCR
jgi:hypothetical protein